MPGTIHSGRFSQSSIELLRTRSYTASGETICQGEPDMGTIYPRVSSGHSPNIK